MHDAYIHRLALQNDGMVATLSASPRYRGEELTVNVYAHAMGYALVTWGLQLSIDTSVLEYVSGAGSPLFNAAIINIDATGSTIGALAVGIKSTTTVSEVTSARISIFNATLRIRTTAPIGPCTDAVRLTVDEMINPGSMAWVAAVPGKVVDYTMGEASSLAAVPEVGAIEVRAVQAVALLAWLDAPLMANLYLITGGRRMQPVHAERLYDRHQHLIGPTSPPPYVALALILTGPGPYALTVWQGGRAQSARPVRRPHVPSVG